MADRRPEKFWSRWTMTLGVVAVLGIAAATRAQAEEIVIRPVVLDSNFEEVRVVSTEFKFAPATVLVIAGRSVTLVLDNSQAETEHGINLPAFGFYLKARAGQVTRKTFTFYGTGEYEFMCDLPGHQEAGMKGKLIVRAP
jgi:plastocyanin